MRSRLALFALLAALPGAACGNSIGDACTSSTECSSEGDRICDLNSPDGYCTIEGCDFGTCPEEAVCVRFFPGAQQNTACTDTTGCALDELCSNGFCVPRSVERRFCMLTCDGHGDCRDGYECRDATRMQEHGGEPVPDPNATSSSTPTSFCAAGRPCASDGDCDLGDVCDTELRRCQRP
jgi:hypothetical protein